MPDFRDDGSIGIDIFTSDLLTKLKLSSPPDVIHSSASSFESSATSFQSSVNSLLSDTEYNDIFMLDSIAEVSVDEVEEGIATMKKKKRNKKTKELLSSRKGVRFARNTDGSITVKAKCFLRDSTPSMWRTPEEQAQTDFDCETHFDRVMESRPDYGDAIEMLHYSYKKSVEPCDTQYCLTVISRLGSARGLECNLEFCQRLRRKHIRSVLRAQEEQRAIGKEHRTSGAKAIRRASMKTSRPGRQFSVNIGRNDADEAIRANVFHRV
jgi:hypothetical protein